MEHTTHEEAPTDHHLCEAGMGLSGAMLRIPQLSERRAWFRFNL